MPDKTIENARNGLVLMSVITGVWAFIVENAMRGEDYWIPAILYSVLLIWFAFNIYQLSRRNSGIIREPVTDAGRKERKRLMIWFNVIGAAEGLAIFLTANILINNNLGDYFISSMALIVGLHFFPLGMLFKRPFDYYMGALITAVALAGLYLTYTHILSHNHTTAVVGMFCMLTTATYGVRMIMAGQKELRLNR